MLVTGSPGGRTIINTVSRRRARGHGVRPDRARRRSTRRGCTISGCPTARRSRARRGVERRRCSRRCSAHREHDGPGRTAGREMRTASGSRPTARRTASTTSGRPDSKASVPRAFDSARDATIGLVQCSRAQHHHRHHHLLLRRAGRALHAITRHHSRETPEGPPMIGEAFFIVAPARDVPDRSGLTRMDFSKLDGLDPGGGAGRRDRRSADGRLHEPGGARADHGDRVRDLLQPHAQHALDEGGDLRQPAAGHFRARRLRRRHGAAEGDAAGHGNVCHTGERTASSASFRQLRDE